MALPRIDEYRFGYIVVDGKSYTRDLIITPDRVIPNWWRIEGHRLQLPDITKYLDLDSVDVDVVVIGSGYNGLMKVDREVLEEFRRRGWEVYVYDTRRSVELYNSLIDEGKRVLALLHLTC